MVPPDQVLEFHDGVAHLTIRHPAARQARAATAESGTPNIRHDGLGVQAEATARGVQRATRTAHDDRVSQRRVRRRAVDPATPLEVIHATGSRDSDAARAFQPHQPQHTRALPGRVRDIRTLLPDTQHGETHRPGIRARQATTTPDPEAPLHLPAPVGDGHISPVPIQGNARPRSTMPGTRSPPPAGSAVIPARSSTAAAAVSTASVANVVTGFETYQNYWALEQRRERGREERLVEPHESRRVQ